MERKSKDITNDEVSGLFSPHAGKLHISNFPYKILQRILRYFSCGEIAKLRLVSKLFNEICEGLLNSEFYRLKTAVEDRYTYVKSQMPRRESARREHKFFRQMDIVETLRLRVGYLNLHIGKHVRRNHCCFFPGEVLDEVNRILNYVKKTRRLNRQLKVTRELFDLSKMAVEFFKAYIEPTLPEVIDFVDLLGNSLTDTSTGTATEINKAQPEPAPSQSQLDSLKNASRVVYRNRTSINAANSTGESIIQTIADIERILHQNNCKEIDGPKICVNELLFQLNQCNLMITLFESQLSNSERLNKLSSVKLVEVGCQDSNSPNCASTSKNADNNNEFHNISSESVASTSTVYNKRKGSEDISQNVLKKRRSDRNKKK